jgi:hypothetical protein
MIAARIAIVLALLTAGRMFAQQASTNAAPVIDFGLSPSEQRWLDEFKLPPPSESLKLGKHLQLEGPLVAPMKSKKIWDFPRKFLQMISPFSKSSGSAPTEDVPVESRAWSTIVGWTPGQSPFPDDTHHEPQLRLLSISGGK